MCNCADQNKLDKRTTSTVFRAIDRTNKHDGEGDDPQRGQYALLGMEEAAHHQGRPNACAQILGGPCSVQFCMALFASGRSGLGFCTLSGFDPPHLSFASIAFGKLLHLQNSRQADCDWIQNLAGISTALDHFHVPITGLHDPFLDRRHIWSRSK